MLSWGEEILHGYVEVEEGPGGSCWSVRCGWCSSRAARSRRSPHEDQRRIVAEVEQRLSAIDAMRASLERARRRSKALRAAILDRAFRGELVPQDPADEPAENLLTRIRES